MGEEPDGQYMMPEDYAALYLQCATAIHRVDPKLKLGGPVFEGVNEDIKVWPDARGRNSWFGRFLAYLKDHGRMNDLTFMSFEHYPVSRLAKSPGRISTVTGIDRGHSQNLESGWCSPRMCLGQHREQRVVGTDSAHADMFRRTLARR